MNRKAPPPAYPPGGGFDPKPGLHSKGDLHDPKKSGRQHRRNLSSPCDRPPATPGGVKMRFRAIEAKTHLEFKGRIDWNDVTEDTSGFPINTVDRWDIEWRAVIVEGDVVTPIEVEHAALTAATNPAANVFLYTTGRNTDWIVGDRVQVKGCTPDTDYNITGVITHKPAANQFKLESNDTGLGAAKDPGEVFNLSTKEDFHHKFRNPKRRIALRKAEMVVLTSDHESITGGSNPAGSTYRFNTGNDNTYQVNDYVKVEGVSPAAYNGVWRVTNRVDNDTFEVAGDTSSLAAAGAGDVYLATTAFRYTTRGASGFNLGQSTKITGCKPETEFNGTWDITKVTGEDVFEVQPNRPPNDDLNDAQTLGVAFDEDDFLHVTIPHVPRPKTWSWQARVRCRSGEGCWSAFSRWTTAILPWDGAEPRPPTPTYGDFPITFDTKGKDDKHKLRLLFTYDEVGFWDVPGGDREDDVRGYDVQIDQSTDGATWDDAHGGGKPYRTQHRPAMDEDADTERVAVFPRISRRFWYRARVRTVDRFSRKGAWSDWTDPALPFDDDAPPKPKNVEVYPQSTDRVVVAWDDPTIDLPTSGTVSGTSGTPTLAGIGTHFLHQIEAGAIVKVFGNTYTVSEVTSATALTLMTNLSNSPSGHTLYEVVEDPDIAMYAVQLADWSDVNLGVQPNVWSDVYARDRVNGNRKAFKVKDADVGLTFYARVRSLDAARNRSKWVPAWVKDLHAGVGNDDPDVDGDGVVVLPGMSSVIVEFQNPRGEGQIEETTTKRWENLTTNRLYFLKARMTCGDRENTSGEPTGADIIVQITRFLDDGVSSAHLFTFGNRLRIQDGEWRSGLTVPPDFEITYLDPGEAISATVQQIGSDHPGNNLVIQVTLSPAPPLAV